MLLEKSQSNRRSKSQGLIMNVNAINNLKRVSLVCRNKMIPKVESREHNNGQICLKPFYDISLSISFHTNEFLEGIDLVIKLRSRRITGIVKE